MKGCSIGEIKNNLFKDVKSKVEGRSTTIKMDNNGLIRFDYSKSKLYKTEAQQYNVVQSKVKAIKEVLRKEEVPNQFIDSFLSIGSDNKGSYIQYTFPKNLENLLQRKFVVEEENKKDSVEFSKEKKEERELQMKIPFLFENQAYFNIYDDTTFVNDPENPIYSDKTKQKIKDNNNLRSIKSVIEFKKSLKQEYISKRDAYILYNIKDKGTPKYKKDIKIFNDNIHKLEQEIEYISKNELQNAVEDIKGEIAFLSNLLDDLDTDIFNYLDVEKRINYLSEIILGKNLSNDDSSIGFTFDADKYDNYNNDIYRPVYELNKKYEDAKKKYVKNLLKNDVFFQDSEFKDNEEVINFLISSAPKEDIFITRYLFLGITSDNDLATTTLALNNLREKLNSSRAYIKPYVMLLVDSDKKLKQKKFNFSVFRDIDSNGVDTGRIIMPFSSKYYEKLSEYKKAAGIYYKSLGTKTAKTAYANAMASLGANSDIIDVRKIKSIKELFKGTEYEKYFSFSEREMSEYENSLKSRLGFNYDYYIDEAIANLNNYRLYVESQRMSTNKYANRNIFANSPFELIVNFYSTSRNMPIQYSASESVYNLSSYVSLIPKLSNDTYYNTEFRDKVLSDIDAYNYWDSLRNLYLKHINPTYSDNSVGNINMMYWAKFEKHLLQDYSAAKKNGTFKKTFFSKTYYKWRQKFYDTEYNDANRDTIKSNYNDNSRKELLVAKEALNLKSLEYLKEDAKKRSINVNYNNISKKDLIDVIARDMVYKSYDMDLTTTTLALSDLASLHKARKDSKKVIDMLYNYHINVPKSIKKNGEKTYRGLSNKKFESWKTRVVYNRSNTGKGTSQFKDNIENIANKESTIAFFRLYNNIEKELKDTVLNILKNKDDISEGMSFSYQGNTYTYENKNFYISANNSLDKVEVSSDIFWDKLQEYYTEDIVKRGIGVSFNGIVAGMIGNLSMAYLGLSPVGGIFNRMEGKLSNMIADKEGYFWTRGNLAKASIFLTGVNTIRFTDKYLSAIDKRKIAQIQTLEALMSQLGAYQDIKNELDKIANQNKTSKMRNLSNVFRWAVDNPEFKNQAEPFLAMLYDIKVKNNKGEEYRVFDGTGFRIYKPGTLELLDEFKYNSDGTINEDNIGWENFITNSEAYKFGIRTQDAVARIQGNYNELDSIVVRDTMIGKALTMFTRWLFEHINQRLGIKKFDLIQGKKEKRGRVLAGFSNPFVGAITTTVVGGITLGSAPLALLAAGGAAGSLILPRMIKLWLRNRLIDNGKTEKTLIQEALISAGYMEDIIYSTIDFPIQMATGRKIIGDKRIVNTSSFLNERERNLLASMGANLGYTLSMLMIVMIAKTLSWDDDDDEDDAKRKLYNAIDNLGDRMISSQMVYMNPDTFISDRSKLTAITPLRNVIKFLTSIQQEYSVSGNDEGELLTNGIKMLQPFIPIFSTALKVVTGEAPLQDKKEYNKTNWYDKYTRGENFLYKSKFTNERKRFGKEVEEMLIEKYKNKEVKEEKINMLTEYYQTEYNQEYNKALKNAKEHYNDGVKDQIEKEKRKIMRNFGNKEKGESFKEAYERVDFKPLKERAKKMKREYKKGVQ